MNSKRALCLVISAMSLSWAAAAPLNFPVGGHTNYGDWSGAVQVSECAWKPGDTVSVNMTLKVTEQHMQNLHFPNDQCMSTIVTPT